MDDDGDGRSPFDELVLSKDWDAVRRNVRQQESTPMGGTTIGNSIISLLKHGKGGEYPIDILQLLFEKHEYTRSFMTLEIARRDTIRCHTKHRSSRYIQHMLWVISCYACNFGVPPLQPLSVFESILNVGARDWDDRARDVPGMPTRAGFKSCTELEKRNFVCLMWSNFLGLNPWFVSGSLRQESEQQLLSIQSISDLEKPSNVELQNLWQRTLMVFRLGETDTSTNPTLLHHLVQNGYSVFLVWLVAKLHPEQLRRRDDNGCIPLHYAYNEESCPPGIFASPFSIAGVDMRSVTYVGCLLNLFQQGARYADSNGKLPLMNYLAKLPFVSYRDNARVACNKLDGRDYIMNEQWRYDIQLLIMASPEALKTRDLKTRLLPFMTPSFVLTDFERETDERETDERERMELYEEEALNFTFDMLRTDPSVLNIFIDPDQSFDSFHAKHLKGEISKLEETIARQREEIESLRRGGGTVPLDNRTSSLMKREDCSNNNVPSSSSSFPTPPSNEDYGGNSKAIKRVKLNH